MVEFGRTIINRMRTVRRSRSRVIASWVVAEVGDGDVPSSWVQLWEELWESWLQLRAARSRSMPVIAVEGSA